MHIFALTKTNTNETATETVAAIINSRIELGTIADAAKQLAHSLLITRAIDSNTS